MPDRACATSRARPSSVSRSRSTSGGAVSISISKQNHGGANSDDNENNNLGRIRLSVTTAPAPLPIRCPQSVRDILAIPRAQRTPEQMAAPSSATGAPRFPNGASDNDAHRATCGASIPKARCNWCWRERTEDHRETHILKRGDFLQPDRVVTPGMPAFLNPLPAGAPPNRLTFARWLVDRQSPTTARSIVNRVWQAYFGTGIVATAENLGTQCEPPSNQELLDWLAVEFMDSGWSLKKLQRLIVTSATYRQIVECHAGAAGQRPGQSPAGARTALRVDAETGARHRAGGQRPAQSDRSAVRASFRPRRRSSSCRRRAMRRRPGSRREGPDRYRRALYTFRFRSVPYPVLQAFDAPNGEMSCVRRARSNTPLQALTTLNEPLFVESAQALAARVLKEGGPTDRERIAYAFRLCHGAHARRRRRPTCCSSLLAKEEKRIADGWVSAQDLAGRRPANGVPRYARRASWRRGPWCRA